MIHENIKSFMFAVYTKIALFMCRFATVITILFCKIQSIINCRFCKRCVCRVSAYEYINNFVVRKKMSDDRLSITIDYIPKKCMLCLYSRFFNDLESIGKYFDIGNDNSEYLDEFVNCLFYTDETSIYKFDE